MENKRKTLGILGGLGPMATVYFYELLTRHTRASCDQEHLDLVISSRATTPDRTAYIIGESEDSPLPAMLAEAKKLADYGAQVLVMPCNTAHYFFDSVRCAVEIPVISIIDATLTLCSRLGCRRVGLLATRGTVETKTYQRRAGKLGIECAVPEEADQALVTSLIYDDIKQGKAPDMEKFRTVSAHLREKGCECIILGCTELSLIKRENALGREYVDSMEALAFEAIRECGGEPTGFDFL